MDDDTRKARKRANRKRYEEKRKIVPEMREKHLAKRRRRYAKHAYKMRKIALNYATRKKDERAFLTGRPDPTICDICGGQDNGRRLAFDHCHINGHFRGWLCGRCNTVLGQVEDDASLLRKMIAYLQRTQETASPQFVLPGI